MSVTSEVKEGRDPQRWEEWNSRVEVREIVKRSFEAELGSTTCLLSQVCMYWRYVPKKSAVNSDSINLKYVIIWPGLCVVQFYALSKKWHIKGTIGNI